MSYKYIDLSKGRVIFLTALAKTGLNYDLEGNHYFLIQKGFEYYDATKGYILTSANQQLMATGQMPGSNLVATNTRVGSRKSMSPLGSDTVANELDSWVQNGITYIGVSQGATNLVSTVLTDAGSWGGTGVTPSFVGYDVDGNAEYDLAFDGDGTARAFSDLDIPSASLDRVNVCQAKIQSGALDSGTNYFAFRGSFATKGTTYDATANLTSDYQEIVTSVTSADVTDQWVIRINNTVPVTIRVKLMRAADSSAPVPAFLDGTGAGETYGTDLVSCTPTWGAAGAILQQVQPYGWSAADNPANVNARLWNSDGANVNTLIQTGSGKPQFEGTLADSALLSNTLSVVAETWNGTTTTIRKDAGLVDSTLNSAIPSGDLIVGNYLAGTLRPFHGILSTLLLDHVATEAEYATWLASSVNQEVQ